MASQTKNRVFLFAAVGCGLVAVLALCGALVMMVGVGKSSPSGGLLEKTSVTEKTLNRTEQIKLLNEFSPVVVPPVASDVQITYQRFQDARFDGSFVLPKNDFDAFVSKLTPASPAARKNQYLGRPVGAYQGRIWTETPQQRVHVEYVSQ